MAAKLIVTVCNLEYVSCIMKKEMATHSVFLPEEFHRQRSLEGYSPYGHKESDMTE